MRASRLIALVLLLLFAGWALVGCGSGSASGSAGTEGGSAGSGGDTVSISREAADTTVTLNTGQALEMVLEGNPSTGYEWTLEPPFGNSLSEKGVKQVLNTDSSVVGAPATYHFNFLAEGPGETVLNFLYKRPWETTPDDQTVSVTVVVE
ncbi:MAG: protease inhibitor I42 family protein [Gaiellales bacterium]|nr:protease inhibitor I42 family protein [Gaiellales bacterium]